MVGRFDVDCELDYFGVLVCDCSCDCFVYCEVDFYLFQFVQCVQLCEYFFQGFILVFV